jgi:hypothetical protein
MLIKNIQSRIYEIRNERVMFDFDLAALYEVETRSLKQAVKRNLDRFPNDFMFVLTETEMNNMVSQTVIPSKSYFGGSAPMVFTEQGVSMLSSVLKSKKAIQVNISIMRVFVAVKQMVVSNTAIAKKLEELETKYNKQFKDVYEALSYLMETKKLDDKQKQRTKIGFKKN